MSEINVATLRAGLREAYIEHPDDSHGQGYINHGILTGLRVVAELVGDLDLYARCEPEGDPRQIGERNWCKTHIAPMGHRWSCELAQAPWVWRNDPVADELAPEEPQP